jgi:hypothetical protein
VPLVFVCVCFLCFCLLRVVQQQTRQTINQPITQKESRPPRKKHHNNNYKKNKKTKNTQQHRQEHEVLKVLRNENSLLTDECSNTAKAQKLAGVRN